MEIILVFLALGLVIAGAYKYVVWASKARSTDTLLRAGYSREAAKRIIDEAYKGF